MKLFTTENGAVTRGANTMGVTASLTSTAGLVVEDIFAKLTADIETYSEVIENSKTDSNVMDKLINDLYDLNELDIDFLKEESEDTLERALKSQQSKRSRTKSKPMTEANYKQLLNASVSEMLIRMALGKPKGATVGSSSGRGLSLEDIDKLRGDLPAINKAIRNVQSRKSIAKSKLDFDECDEHYQGMLALEAQLKELRDEANGVDNSKANEALAKQEQLKDLLMNVNSKDLKVGDARALIEQVQSLIVDDTPEATNEEVDTAETEEAII